MLAVATDSATIVLWNIAEAIPRATVACPFESALFIAFDPHG